MVDVRVKTDLGEAEVLCVVSCNVVAVVRLAYDLVVNYEVTVKIKRCNCTCIGLCTGLTGRGGPSVYTLNYVGDVSPGSCRKGHNGIIRSVGILKVDVLVGFAVIRPDFEGRTCGARRGGIGLVTALLDSRREIHSNSRGEGYLKVQNLVLVGVCVVDVDHLIDSLISAGDIRCTVRRYPLGVRERREINVLVVFIR